MTIWWDVSNGEIHALTVLSVRPSSMEIPVMLRICPLRAASSRRNDWKVMRSPTWRTVRTSRSRYVSM